MEKSRVKAIALTVGDEILIGQIVDSNSAYIGQRLSEIGVEVVEIVSLSDSLEDIKRGVRRALERVDVVIMTGGLGPTKDDITKMALCELFEVGVYRDAGSYSHIEEFLRKRGVEFNELNRAQADIVEGFEVLKNECGTAPGMVRRVGEKMLFCLPGVPFEMKWLVENHLVGMLRGGFELGVVSERMTVLVYGLPESELAQRIAVWESECRRDGFGLAYLPNVRGIRLRLSGGRREELEVRFRELAGLIPECYLGEEPTSIEAELAKLLKARGMMLGVAESCTGGALSARCTSLAGSSEWYCGGVVSYCNSVKSDVLGVSDDLLDRFGAVSREVVEAMVVGVCERLGVECGIATSGIAGPGGGGGGKFLGDVWVAVKVGSVVRSWFCNYGQPRDIFIQRTVSSALNFLRLELLS